jgi:glycosyltransferase involved in cell wall biosynthesis
MKICYVLPQHHQNSAENFFHIINFLEELGKKVELYVVIEHGDSTSIVNSAQQTFVLSTQENPISHFSRAFKIIQIYFQLYKKGVDIFFSRASLTGVLPLILANRILNFNRSSIVFWSCGIDVIPLSYFPNRRNIKRLISKLLARIVYIGINYLATGPEKMVDHYHQLFQIRKNKILTLYNDISLNRFFPLPNHEKLRFKKELLNSQKIILLFVHTFNRSRGADLLPLIALELKNKCLDAVIIAIGRPGDYSSELDLQIENNQLQNYLINLGQIPNRKIENFYQISDLFLMPSRGEGFPRVMLEAMACSSPTLAFDVGGVSEIMGYSVQNELLIPLNEKDKFIDQAIKLTQNKKLRNHLGNAAYAKVTEYSTENIVEMYTNIMIRIHSK